MLVTPIISPVQTTLDVASICSGSGISGSPWVLPSSVWWKSNTAHLFRAGIYNNPVAVNWGMNGSSTVQNASFAGVGGSGGAVIQYTGTAGSNVLQMSTTGYNSNGTPGAGGWATANRIENLTFDMQGGGNGLVCLACHRSVFRNLRVRNTSNGGIGYYFGFCILDMLDSLVCSTTGNIDTWTNGLIPAFGLDMNGDGNGNKSSANTVLNPCMEGCSTAGILLAANSQRTIIIGGTSEASPTTNAVGLEIDGDGNAVVGLDMEANYRDVKITGKNNKIDTCVCAEQLWITGNFNTVMNSQICNLLVDTGATCNSVIGNQLKITALGTPAYTNNGTRTLILSNWDAQAAAAIANSVP